MSPLAFFPHLLYMPSSLSMLALVCLGSGVSITLGLASDPAKAVLILKALAQHLPISMHIPWLFLTSRIQFPLGAERSLTPSLP